MAPVVNEIELSELVSVAKAGSALVAPIKTRPLEPAAVADKAAVFDSPRMTPFKGLWAQLGLQIVGRNGFGCIRSSDGFRVCGERDSTLVCSGRIGGCDGDLWLQIHL